MYVGVGGRLSLVAVLSEELMVIRLELLDIVALPSTARLWVPSEPLETA